MCAVILDAYRTQKLRYEPSIASVPCHTRGVSHSGFVTLAEYRHSLLRYDPRIAGGSKQVPAPWPESLARWQTAHLNNKHGCAQLLSLKKSSRATRPKLLRSSASLLNMVFTIRSRRSPDSVLKKQLSHRRTS